MTRKEGLALLMAVHKVSIPLVEITQIDLPEDDSTFPLIHIQYSLNPVGGSASPQEREFVTRLDMGKQMFLDVSDTHHGAEVASFLRLLSRATAAKVRELVQTTKTST